MRKEIKNWIEQAREEFETAKISYDGKEWFAAAFWCQQAAEKMLKALLIKEKNEFPKIHDLVSLGKKVGLPDHLLNKTKELNRVYLESRYGVGLSRIPAKSFDKEAALKSIQTAKEILE